MGYLYHVILYQPLINALVFLYQSIAFEDLGVAIIMLTVIIRVIFLPLFQKAMRQQTVIQTLRPELEKIDKEYEGDLEKKGRAQMELYKKHQVNPFSMFFILFLQIIILIPLFQIFYDAPGSLSPKEFYSFISAPEVFNHSFLGVIDLKVQSLVLIIIASLLQYVQTKLNLSVQKNVTPMSKNLAIIGPVIIVAVLWSAPSAVWLYLLASNLFSLIQQIVVNRQLKEGELKQA